MRGSFNIVVFTAVLACTAPLVSGFGSGRAISLRKSPSPSLIASRPSHASSRPSPLPGLVSMSAERPLGRREALAALTAAATILQSTPAQAAYVGEPPSIFSQLQGGIQGTLQPGHWLGQFIGINSHKEVWEFDASPEQVSKAMTTALKEITPKQSQNLVFTNLDIIESTPTHLRVNTWTKNEWLDVLDVTFSPLPEDKGKTRRGAGCQATVSIFATGFFPTSIPLAPLLNLMLFFFPFASPSPRGGMLQNNRCQELYQMVRDHLPKVLK